MEIRGPGRPSPSVQVDGEQSAPTVQGARPVGAPTADGVDGGAVRATEASALGAPAVPPTTLGADEVGGARAVAGVLYSLGEPTGDPSVLMARFLKIQCLDGSTDAQFQADAGDGHSEMNQLAITIARSIAKRAQNDPTISASYLMFLLELADTEVVAGVMRKQKKIADKNREALEGQMDGKEEKSVDEKKREGQLKGRDADGTVTAGDGATFFASPALDVSAAGVSLVDPRDPVVAAESRRSTVADLLDRASDHADDLGAGQLTPLRS